MSSTSHRVSTFLALRSLERGNRFTLGLTVLIIGLVFVMNAYYYETFRIVGFPAIAEQHVTFGLGYDINSKFAINAGYMHAFSNSVTETGTAPDGSAASVKSTMSEDSYEFGLSWRF